MRAALPVLLAATLTLTASVGCREKRREVPKVAVEPIHGGSEDDSEGTTTGGESPDKTSEKPPKAPAGPSLEREPNDIRPQASKLPINGGLRGSLSTHPELPGPDYDWYVMELSGTTSQQVRIQLSPEDNSNFKLQWMMATPPVEPKKGQDPAGVLADVDNAKDGGVEVLPPTLLPPGKHYFRVLAKEPRRRGKRARKPPPERPYRLTTTVVDPEGNIEQEPNNERKDAGILRAGEDRQGYLGWFKDTDWYQLDLEGVPPEARLRIDVTGVPGVKSRLWVTDKRGRSLVKVPEAKLQWPVGSPVTARDMGIDPQSVPYFVEVRSMRSASPHDRYTISLIAETPLTAHESEPNWRPGSAHPLRADEPMDGYVGHPTDWDVFRIDADEPMIATVVTSGIPTVDLKLELIDHTRKVVRTINEMPSGSPETLPLIAVGPQPAFVRVSSKDGGFNVDRGYRIAVTLAEAGDREIEPNDEFRDAGRVTLPFGKPHKGFIHPRGDLDYYAINVTTETPDETRILTLRLTGAEGLTLDLALYDSERALITRKGGISGGKTRTITHSFAAGRYYVRVKEVSGQAGNGNDPYTVELAE